MGWMYLRFTEKSGIRPHFCHPMLSAATVRDLVARFGPTKGLPEERETRRRACFDHSGSVLVFEEQGPLSFSLSMGRELRVLPFFLESLVERLRSSLDEEARVRGAGFGWLKLHSRGGGCVVLSVSEVRRLAEEAERELPRILALFRKHLPSLREEGR